MSQNTSLIDLTIKEKVGQYYTIAQQLIYSNSNKSVGVYEYKRLGWVEQSWLYNFSFK